MVLVPTPGTASAGVWVRGVCVNDDMRLGTMFSYISKALSMGYGVCVLNPNQTRDSLYNAMIACNRSIDQHITYCHDHVFSGDTISSIIVVANQGSCDAVLAVMGTRERFRSKVSHLAFFDPTYVISSHNQVISTVNLRGRVWLSRVEGFSSAEQSTLTARFGCPVMHSGQAKANKTPFVVCDQVFSSLQPFNLSLQSSVVDQLRRRENAWLQKHCLH
eukprot:TRINITY_DN691_c0_g1_i9.p1 TRINITY_DN691_c0_g1~~TRINITY_DN691_c0_g1_i9.p1  ORF type:complete len:218 (-),score=33.13 TRINITY_DN691_c0_g1_i9:110-763(-)